MTSFLNRLRRWTGSLSVRSVLIYFACRLHLLALPVLLAGFFEYMNRSSAAKTVGWMLHSPHHFALNVVYVFALLLLFASLIGRTWPAYALLSVILAVIGFISGIKMKILGVPLMPWDVVLSKETQDMTPYVSGIVNIKLISVVLLFIAVSFVLMRFVPSFRSKYRWPEKLLFLAVAVFLGFCAYKDKPIDLQNKFKVHNISWDQAANYKENGFLVATAMNMDLVFIPQPDNYNEQTITQIVDSVPRRTNIDPNVKPNIIVVLSEAFWDPTQLPNVTFDHDPVPTIHELQKTHSNGYMISPQFGGGTANVEFEVLSGNSMHAMPPGSTPYIQYVNRGIDSIASILTRQGYESTAINPFHDWFFNSKTVYKNFGFGRFISQEFFPRQTIKGFYIEDAEVADIIKSTSDKSAGPDFIFANTMENHFPFIADKFNKNTFKVSGNVTDSTKGILETYATGASDADLMLKTLIDHYKAKNEPTIICFFGDHKPVLGDEFAVYKDAGFLQDNDPDSYKKLYSVPVVVWDNYLPPHQDKLDISASLLGPYLLNLAQKEGTPYTDFLYALSQKYPVIPSSYRYKEFGVNEEDVKPYKLLQYDMIFGKQYSLGGLKEKIVQPGFQLGFGPMTVTAVSPDRVKAGEPFGGTGDDSTLTVSGGPFVPQCTLYVNDKAMTTKRQPDGKLSAAIPNSYFKKAGKLKLQVRIIDSQNIALSESNVVDIPISP